MKRLLLTHLSYAYLGKKKAMIPCLHDLSFSLDEGECLVILGPSGSGKTTLLKLVAGLLFPQEGTITLSGVDANLLKPKDRNLAYVSQSVTTYSFLSVYENIALPLKAQRIDLQEIEERVTGVAERLGISHLLSRKPRELSEGQRQKVALARSLVKKPDLYLFDEPFSNLDGASRIKLRKDLKDIHEKEHASILFVSHDLNDALALSDRVLLLNQGRIEEEGDIHQMLKQPGSRFVATFLGASAENL